MWIMKDNSWVLKRMPWIIGKEIIPWETPIVTVIGLHIHQANFCCKLKPWLDCFMGRFKGLTSILQGPKHAKLFLQWLGYELWMYIIYDDKGEIPKNLERWWRKASAQRNYRVLMKTDGPQDIGRKLLGLETHHVD